MADELQLGLGTAKRYNLLRSEKKKIKFFLKKSAQNNRQLQQHPLEDHQLCMPSVLVTGESTNHQVYEWLAQQRNVKKDYLANAHNAQRGWHEETQLHMY